MVISTRIKEERERVGLTQAGLAKAIGTTRRSIVNWESEAAQPPAIAVAAMASVGVDVLYILTGQRSEGLLSADERRLLADFRAVPDAAKEGIKKTLEAFIVAGNQKLKKAG